VINGTTRGRRWSGAGVCAHLAHAASAAGVRRRVAPHQLRHAHAVEMAREGVPLTSFNVNSATATSASPRSVCKASTTPRSSTPSIRAARLSSRSAQRYDAERQQSRPALLAHCDSEPTSRTGPRCFLHCVSHKEDGAYAARVPNRESGCLVSRSMTGTHQRTSLAARRQPGTDGCLRAAGSVPQGVRLSGGSLAIEERGGDLLRLLRAAVVAVDAGVGDGAF